MALLNEKVFYEVLKEYENKYGLVRQGLKVKLKSITSFHDVWGKILETDEPDVRKKLNETIKGCAKWLSNSPHPPENELEIFKNLFASEKNQVPQKLCIFYDNDRDEVTDRIIAFQQIYNDINKNGYPDYSIPTTYLWMYFPNDYVDYSDYDNQPEIIEKVLDKNYDREKTIDKSSPEVMKKEILNFYDLLDQMSRYILDGNGPDGFLERYRKAISDDPQCYCDPECSTLAEDIAYYFIVYTVSNGKQVNGKSGKEFYERWEKINMEANSRAVNVLFYGIPGAGKSYAVKEKIKEETGVGCLSEIDDRIERVIFHRDYTYSDFVGQIMPKLVEVDKDDCDGENKKPENDSKNTGKKLIYEFIPGPFTRILKKAVDDPDHMYYLIIEEINRGNAPAIFGDIFQLLDRKDDGCSEYEITNREIADAVFHDDSSDTNDIEKNGERKIYLPANLSIYATMNTSDQNVFTLDTAFQRRWDMVLISSDEGMEDNSAGSDDIREKLIPGEKDISWGNFIRVINKKILKQNDGLFSSEDKRLGVFFVKPGDLAETGDLQDILMIKRKKFSNKVLKYLWDDAFKMNRTGGEGNNGIFNSDMDSLEKVVNTYDGVGEENPLEAVLDIDTYNEMKSN